MKKRRETLMKQESGHDTVKVLRLLLGIPHKILSFNELDNISAFVLHELCQDTCLNIDRAAYFVDNPDFNCFKGISGIDRKEEKFQKDPVWQHTHHFNEHMHHSSFNNKVKEINKESTKNHNEKELMQELAKNLCMNNHKYNCFDLKHGNRGYFLYEPSDRDIYEFDEIMDYATGLLALCPIH